MDGCREPYRGAGLVGSLTKDWDGAYGPRVVQAGAGAASQH